MCGVFSLEIRMAYVGGYIPELLMHEIVYEGAVTQQFKSPLLLGMLDHFTFVYSFYIRAKSHSLSSVASRLSNTTD